MALDSHRDAKFPRVGRRTSLIAAVALAACALGTTTANAATPPIKHVCVLILENKDYEEIVREQLAGAVPGRARCPTRASCSPTSTGPRTSSLGNYIAMVSGQAPESGDAGRLPGVHGRLPGDHRRRRPGDGAGLRLPARGQDDRRPARGQGPDLARLHGGHGERGRPAQDMPPPRTQRRRTPRRARAWATSTPRATTRSSTSTRSSTTRGAATPTTSRSTGCRTTSKSIATTPNYSFITPNLCNDGHDEPCVDGKPGGLKSADEFLKLWVPRITGLAGLQGGRDADRHLRRGRGDRQPRRRPLVLQPARRPQHAQPGRRRWSARAAA